MRHSCRPCTTQRPLLFPVQAPPTDKHSDIIHDAPSVKLASLIFGLIDFGGGRLGGVTRSGGGLIPGAAPGKRSAARRIDAPGEGSEALSGSGGHVLLRLEKRHRNGAANSACVKQSLHRQKAQKAKGIKTDSGALVKL